MILFLHGLLTGRKEMLLDYQFFLEELNSRLSERLGQSVQIRIAPVMKNNSVRRDSLTILEEGQNVTPAIYLEPYYQAYCEGAAFPKIISEILERYRERKLKGSIETDFFTERSKALPNLVCRIIGLRKNEELLKDLPHREYLDLAVIYYYHLQWDEVGNAGILVRNEHIKLWGISEDELDHLAWENAGRLLPPEFRTMREMMEDILHTALSDEGEMPLYVLSNRGKSYGAVWMIDPSVLDGIGKTLKDDFYILPSSVHECMILPVSLQSDEEGLQRMVQDINTTTVEPEDVLTDTLYRYFREEGSLKIVRTNGQ